MKRWLLILCVVLAFVACKEEKKDTAQADTKPVVKIGYIASMTGQFAEIGQNTKLAIDLAKADVNSKNIDFDFIVEDYGYDSPRAATAASKLINVDKVNALISFSSKGANVIAPIAQSRKIINFGISNDKHIVQAGSYNFIHWTQSEALVKKFMESLSNKGYKKIVMFVVEQASLQQDGDMIEKLLKEKDLEVERVNFAMDNRDFGLIIDKMKIKDFDAWYIAALPPSLDVFLDVFFQKEVNKPLIAIDSFTFAKNKQQLEGMEYVTVPDGNKELLKRITKENGSTYYFSVGYVYDVAKMLMETYEKFYLENNRIPTSDEMASELLKIKDYDSSVGKISIDENRIVQSQAVIKKIINGVPTEIEE